MRFVPAAPDIPRIIPLLNDPNRALLAMVALLALQPEREADILSLTNVFGITTPDASGSSPALLHSTAALALSSFGPKASAARPVLMKCLTYDDEGLRAASAIALSRIGAPANEVVPTLVEALNRFQTNPSGSGSPLSSDHNKTKTRPWPSGTLENHCRCQHTAPTLVATPGSQSASGASHRPA